MKEGEQSSQSLVELGLLFELGQLIPMDIQRAYKLYEKAGGMGNLDAVIHLAMLHEYGLGGASTAPNKKIQGIIQESGSSWPRCCSSLLHGNWSD